MDGDHAFTYFQQCGGSGSFPICADLTSGLERIGQFCRNFIRSTDIVWARDPETGSVGSMATCDSPMSCNFRLQKPSSADVDKGHGTFPVV